MTVSRRRITLAAALATAFTTALTAAPLAALAQAAYPSNPIKLIVPFPPGGNVDLSARILVPELSKALGQPVVVENKAGAGGTLGLDAVAKAAPDGHTLGIASPINHLAAPSLYPKLPYDSEKDFAPVGLIASVPMVLVVGPSSAVKSVQELVALARQKPGVLTMASAGGGSGNHIVGELFQDAAGIRFVHVPYKGSAPANTDLAGGHVDLHFDQLSSVLPLIQGGKLKPLAVTTSARSALLPGKAPAELTTRLNQALNTVLNKPHVQEQFARLGAEVRPGTSEAYASFIRSEMARTAKIVRDAHITLN